MDFSSLGLVHGPPDLRQPVRLHAERSKTAPCFSPNQLFNFPREAALKVRSGPVRLCSHATILRSVSAFELGVPVLDDDDA